MTFSVDWNEEIDWDKSGRGGRIYWNTSLLCNIETWGMHSCGVFILKKWNSSIKYVDLDAFFAFVAELDEDWQPEEAYFLLSTTQLGFSWSEKLVTHPCVKQVDKFTNKAHGPNTVFLFRWSAAKDF